MKKKRTHNTGVIIGNGECQRKNLRLGGVLYIYTFCRSNSARTRPFYNLRIRCSNPANLSIRTAF